MRILLYLLIFFISSCSEQTGSKNVAAEENTLSDSIKSHLTGLWKGPGDNGWIWDIRTDSVHYFQHRAVYSYMIHGRDLIIDLPGSKDTLRNISVIKDTMYFFDGQGLMTKASRIKDSLISFVTTTGVVPDSLVSPSLLLSKPDFRIISAMKEYDKAQGKLAPDMKACNHWVLNKKEILDILRASQPISGTEWDLAYAVMPCYYKGELLMNGKKGTYKVNAGSFIIITLKDTSLFLGCIAKNKYKYFLEHPNYE